LLQYPGITSDRADAPRPTRTAAESAWRSPHERIGTEADAHRLAEVWLPKYHARRPATHRQEQPPSYFPLKKGVRPGTA
jgi:hypothetical protein